MNPYEIENDELRRARSLRRRREGVDYKLRVIPHSGGMLELVEVDPEPCRFRDYARLMQVSGWFL